MELPPPRPEGIILPPRRERKSPLAPHPGPSRIIEDAAQPHCHDHQHFLASCPTCRQACANARPYPVRRTPTPTRSFGFTDDITENKLKGPPLTTGNAFLTEEEVPFNLSLTVIRFILRLIWPFGRIL